MGTLEMQSPRVFWRLYTLQSKTLITETSKHDILSVSKSAALYQRYVYIKACLEMGHIPRAWRKVKMMFIPTPGKVNYTQGKAYCSISLSFMQKRCKNWRPGISGMKYCGMFPKSLTICLQTTEVHRNHNAPYDYTYTGSSGK